MDRRGGVRSVCALGLAVLMTAVALPDASAAEPGEDLRATSIRGITGSAPHPPIDIDGDAGFNATNGVIGGNGSLAAPYVIANWSIQALLGPAISIVNTRAAFEVRDCALETTDLAATMFLQNSTDASLHELTIANGTDRLVVSLARRVSVTASTMTGVDGNGIRVQDSSDILLENLTVNGAAGSAVEVYYGDNVTLRGSILRDLRGVALTTLLVRGLHIDANRVEAAFSGLWIEKSVGARATFNIIDNVTGDAIALVGSENASAIGNRIHRADVGIWSTTFESGYSRSNLVENNTVENARRGVWLSQAVDSRMRNNTVRNATAHGIVVESSPGAIVSGNLVQGSRWGWSVRSLSGARGEFPAEIRDDNTVDGRKVRYIVDSVDPVIPADPGYVGLVNVSGRLAGPVISGQGEGLMVAASTDLRIDGGVFTANEKGVSVVGSRNITLNGSQVNDSSLIGVEFLRGEGSLVERLRVSGTDFTGISLIRMVDTTLRLSNVTESGLAAVSVGEESTGNEVSGNDLAGNKIGVEARPGSRSNVVHGNALLGSIVHAVDDGQGNRWDRDGRGNYWAGFAAADLDCDGILDQPFVIPEGASQAQDSFPLAKPAGSAIPPCAPGRPVATVDGKRVALDWAPPKWDGDAPVESYRVFRGDAPDALSEIATVKSDHHDDDTVELNQSYYYAVSAGNRVGIGSPSGVTKVEVRWAPAPRADPAAAWIRAEPATPMGGEPLRIRLRAENAGVLVAQPFNATIEIEQSGGWIALATATSPLHALAAGQGFDLVAERTLENGSYRFRGSVSGAGAGNVAENDVLEMILEVGPATKPPSPDDGAQVRVSLHPLLLILALLAVLLVAGFFAAGRRRTRVMRR